MFKDAFGRELQRGDYVVYGKSFGRCAGLGVGRVIRVRESTQETWVCEPTPDDAWAGRIDNVPTGHHVLDVMTLQGWRPIAEPDRCTKTTLMYEERVVRMLADEIPTPQRKMLDLVWEVYE